MPKQKEHKNIHMNIRLIAITICITLIVTLLLVKTFIAKNVQSEPVRFKLNEATTTLQSQKDYAPYYISELQYYKNYIFVSADSELIVTPTDAHVVVPMVKFGVGKYDNEKKKWNIYWEDTLEYENLLRELPSELVTKESVDILIHASETQRLSK